MQGLGTIRVEVHLVQVTENTVHDPSQLNYGDIEPVVADSFLRRA